MLYNLRKGMSRARFNFQIRSVRDTPPMPVIDAAWSIVSLLGKPQPDILMYVLSMKSVYRKIGKGKIIVIADHDTLELCEPILMHHFPGIQFELLDDIDPGLCQRGGTWERLVYLVRRSQEEYVIQVDPDVLVTGNDINEVTDCIERNVAFTYSDDHSSLKTLRDAAEDSKRVASDYVGIALERSFTDWPCADRLKYVRGSSGFAGFARGGTSLSLLEDFHERMRRSLGSRWRDWGTEQSGSNFLIANSPDAAILPFPEYASFLPPYEFEHAKLLHFIGTNRFRNRFFVTQARRILGELLAA